MAKAFSEPNFARISARFVLNSAKISDGYLFPFFFINLVNHCAASLEFLPTDHTARMDRPYHVLLERDESAGPLLSSSVQKSEENPFSSRYFSISPWMKANKKPWSSRRVPHYRQAEELTVMHHPAYGSFTDRQELGGPMDGNQLSLHFWHLPGVSQYEPPRTTVSRIFQISSAMVVVCSVRSLPSNSGGSRLLRCSRMEQNSATRSAHCL